MHPARENQRYLSITSSGTPAAGSHRRADEARPGAVTLFTALDCLEGMILGVTAPSHPHVGWLAFLKQIDRETPAGTRAPYSSRTTTPHIKRAVMKAWHGLSSVRSKRLRGEGFNFC